MEFIKIILCLFIVTVNSIFCYSRILRIETDFGVAEIKTDDNQTADHPLAAVVAFRQKCIDDALHSIDWNGIARQMHYKTDFIWDALPSPIILPSNHIVRNSTTHNYKFVSRPQSAASNAILHTISSNPVHFT